MSWNGSAYAFANSAGCEAQVRCHFVHFSTLLVCHPQHHIRTFMVIGPHPAHGLVLHRLQVSPLLRQPFVYADSVEAVDAGILLWLAGLEEPGLMPRVCTHPNGIRTTYSGPLS